MQRISAFTLMCFLASPAVGQDVPMGCFVRDYGQDHLDRYPEQVVERISIRFGPHDWFIAADVKVLLADQGHAGRDGLAGQRMSEWAGNFNGPLNFGVECDGGGFEVVAKDAHGITIETSGFRLSTDGCGGEGVNSTLLEEGSATTRYRLPATEDAACDW